ncbi:hypothetical protein ACFLZX_04480 [Nanoarchaeota archaeon]
MKKILLVLGIALLLLPAVFSARLGSSVATVTVEVTPGETSVVERIITPINDENVSIKVNIEPAKGLENITEIIDNDFILEPGEEKDARYNFVISEPGTYNGSLLVRFTPTTGDIGVGLEGTFDIFAVEKGKAVDDQTNTTQQENTEENDRSVAIGIIVVLAIVMVGIGIYALVGKRK